MARRRRVVVLVFCLTCLAANFIYSYQESPQLNRSVSPFDGAIQGVGNVAYSAAGWPWAFYERIDRDTLPPSSKWNLLSCVGNLMVWGAIFVIAWWRGNSHQPVSAETKTRRRLHLSLADLFVLMLLVACLFGYIASNRAQYTASQKLVQLIRNHRGDRFGRILLAQFPLQRLLCERGSAPQSYRGCIYLKSLRVDVETDCLTTLLAFTLPRWIGLFARGTPARIKEPSPAVFEDLGARHRSANASKDRAVEFAAGGQFRDHKHHRL